MCFHDISFLQMKSTVLIILWHTLMLHYSDVIRGMMVSQITSLAIVYLTIYSGADQRKHQSSASLAFVRGIHLWPFCLVLNVVMGRACCPTSNTAATIWVSCHVIKILQLIWRYGLKVKWVAETSIDQSHRYGRPQAACCEPAGSYDKTTQTAVCFEHKTQYLLIRAPYTHIVVFWHISNIPPMIS